MLDVAIEAAKAGGNLANNYFKTNPKFVFKKDKSPVTLADIETEKLIRKILSKKFPSHNIIGEELPPKKTGSDYSWVIDPIDGTRDYVRKLPYWATYIALLKDQVPVIGVIYFPEMNILATAQKGKGTYLSGKKAKVSKTKNLKNSYIAFGTIKRFIQYDKMDNLSKILNLSLAGRSYGNLSLKFFLEGKIDVIVESYGAMYDFAAPSIIVEEAGGKFTDWDGNFKLDSGNGIFTNGLLHEEALKILNSN